MGQRKSMAKTPEMSSKYAQRNASDVNSSEALTVHQKIQKELPALNNQQFERALRAKSRVTVGAGEQICKCLLNI